MLPFRMTHAQHPRRPPDSFFALTPAPSRLAPNSHGIISFADPHPLTLLESYRFKNIGGRGHLQLSRPRTPNTASRIHLSFQPLMKCPPRNSFLLIFMQIGGGCRGARLFGTSIPYFQSPIPFLFLFLRTLLHFFALTKNSTLLFSSDSTLFAKNTRGWGTPPLSARSKMKPQGK